MDTFTHHLSVKGHGGTIGTGFPINEESADDSSPQRIYFASPLFTRAITTVPPLSKVSSDLIPAAPIWLRFTGPTFIAKIQAAPDTDTWEKPSYAAEDTQYFDAKYHDRAEVDAAVSRLCDPSLQAEVRRYRAARYNHRMIERKIDRLEGELSATGMKKCASLRRLMAANAKARIEAKRDEEGFVRVALPWEHMRNTLHVDDLDDGL